MSGGSGKSLGASPAGTLLIRDCKPDQTDMTERWMGPLEFLFCFPDGVTGIQEEGRFVPPRPPFRRRRGFDRSFLLIYSSPSSGLSGGFGRGKR